MTRARRHSKILILVFLLLALPRAWAEHCASWESLTRTLAQHTELTINELSAVRQGRAVSNVLEPSHPQEIAVFGGIKAAASGRTYVNRLRDIVNFKEDEDILAIGKFSDPPQLKDLKTLTLTDDEIRSIRNCTIGDCAIKMSAGMIKRFRQDIDWRAPDSGEQATKIFRELLLKTVEQYLKKGDEALVLYVDKDADDPTALARQVSEMLHATEFLSKCAPEFLTYLDRFPQEDLEHVEDFIYWDKAHFDGKPVITMTHSSTYMPGGKNGCIVFTASKQIYATHYFEASLGLTIVLTRLDISSQEESYLFYLNRSRLDVLGGPFNFFKRPLFASRIQEGMKENLFKVRQKLETAQAASE